MTAQNHVPETAASPGRRRLLQATLAGSALGPLAACSSSGTDSGSDIDYSNTIHDGQAAIQRAMADTNTSSVSVALLDGQRVVWQEAFGVIDIINRQPAGINTLYNIGSVSKILAAVSIMILVGRGLVDLDAPVTSYVRDFRMLSPGFQHITVRMLLSHCSGFPGSNYSSSFTFEPLLDYARTTQTILADQHLKHTPGELAVYCNDGFTMAERVVEDVSGQSYASFAKREILEPLEMSLSRFPLMHYPAGSFVHADFMGEDQGQEFVNPHGTGGLSSTPTEMLNLAMMFLQQGEFKGRQILSPEAVAEMGRDQTRNFLINPAPSWKWGLGWDQSDHPGLRAAGFSCWQKNGGTNFFGSDFFVLPDTGLAVMITGNSPSYGAGAIAERILLNALVDKGSLPRLPQKLPVDPPPSTTADAATLEAITGYYGSVEGVSRVTQNDDHSITLMRYEAGQWITVAAGLTRREDGWFAVKGQPLSYRTTDSGPYRYLLMRFTGGYGHYKDFMPYGQKIQAEPPLSTAWRARLGKHWVLVNEHESSTMFNTESPLATLTAIPGLPGYVRIDDRQPLLPETDQRTRQFMKIPVNYGRDLYELIVENKDGGEWLSFGGFRYQPLDSIPAATLGTQTVTIAADGYCQCRNIQGARALSIAGARAWRVFDAQWKVLKYERGPGNIALAADQKFFLMIHGEATSQAHITLT